MCGLYVGVGWWCVVKPEFRRLVLLHLCRYIRPGMCFGMPGLPVARPLCDFGDFGVSIAVFSFLFYYS